MNRTEQLIQAGRNSYAKNAAMYDEMAETHENAAVRQASAEMANIIRTHWMSDEKACYRQAMRLAN